MPETGQPGGAGYRGKSAVTQGGQMAAGFRGPFLRVLSFGNTPGNLNKTIKCPLGVRWNLISSSIYLDTDASVADRYMQVFVFDGDGNRLLLLGQSAAYAANTAGYGEIGPSLQPDTDLYFPYPLVDGMALSFVIANGVAGDVYSGRFVVMEWHS